MVWGIDTAVYPEAPGGPERLLFALSLPVLLSSTKLFLSIARDLVDSRETV